MPMLRLAVLKELEKLLLLLLLLYRRCALWLPPIARRIWRSSEGVVG